MAKHFPKFESQALFCHLMRLPDSDCPKAEPRIKGKNKKITRCFADSTSQQSRGKYLSLFPAPVQGKVFNYEISGEEFWGLEAKNQRKI